MPRPYYIFSNGRIKRSENTIQIENEKGEKKSIPVEDTEYIHIFGEIDLNTKFINFISQHKIPVHFYNYYGFYTGSFIPREVNLSGFLVVKQVEHYLDESKRLEIAKAFVVGAMFHMIRNLRRYDGTEIYIENIEREMSNISGCKNLQELMGCEGRAKNEYYKSFNVFLGNNFLMDKREKHPPTNPLNALISFSNSLIYTTVLGEVYHTQLNSTISYLHQPGERRHSLSLDIAEIFKPLIGDAIIFNLINNRIISIQDFDSDLNFCYLKEEGRKKFIKLFDEKMKTTIKHRKLKRNVSYKNIIRYECYKLIKHLIGEEKYTPFKAWW